MSYALRGNKIPPPAGDLEPALSESLVLSEAEWVEWINRPTEVSDGHPPLPRLRRDK